MPPKTAFLASKMHVVCPQAISHRFRRPLDPIFIDFQSLQTSKKHEKHIGKQRILLCCIFPLRIPKIAFPDPFGTPKSSKIGPETPPGAPKMPQDGVQTVPWTPKMAVQASPEPSKPPSRPSKIQFWRSRDPPSADFGRPGPILAPIWRSQASFWTPRDQFFSPQALISLSKLPFAPVLQVSKL